MRILIYADMEGISGIVHWDQVCHDSPMYQEGRRLYTEEINAAVRGAFAGGATQVVVVDSHGAGAAGNMGGPAFNSLIPELIHEDCEFVTHLGWANYFGALEEGIDATFFVGIHARGGTLGGVLSHTVSSQVWRTMRINGTEVGEIGVVAAICGAYGVPLTLVTGDDKACQEAKSLLGEDLQTVAVKKGLGRYAARNIPPVRARKMIESGARVSIGNIKNQKPWTFDGPVTVEYEIVTADRMDPYRRIPGVECVGDNIVRSTADDFLTAWERIAPFARELS